MSAEFEILNLHQVRFECTFGRGCDGVCCREGRPPVYPEEIDCIADNLEKFLPFMRSEARTTALRTGFLADRLRRIGQRVMRVSGGWCIFFHQGCVLHQVGAAEGDPYRYKPSLCALFPIQQDGDDRWYIRQKGYKGERWDLHCLDPTSTDVPAAESLTAELLLARHFDQLQKLQIETIGETGHERISDQDH
ncbi:MAG: DUF3109 family protein [Pirellulales bacterium]